MFRRLSRRQFLASAALAGASVSSISRAAVGADVDDPVSPWQTDVKISPVSKIPNRHTMHTYYLLNPESPDGSKVLFFASTDPAGQAGKICMLDRHTGAETVLADDIHTEDAHRVALQQ